MKQKELNKIITSHEKLGCHDKCTDLSNVDLNDINSKGTYLINTNLNNPNLRDAKLRVTNLGWVKWHETRGKKLQYLIILGMIIMINSITVWQVRNLIKRKDIDNLKFISRAPYTPSHKSYSKVIFKEVGKKQLYIFYWIKDVKWADDESDWDMSNVSTIESPFVKIYVDANINDYHVKVYPVKAKKVTITRYIRED